MSAFFTISADTDVRWGDYGGILAHGMGEHLSRQDGLVQLQRTGPFIPPLSFPIIGGFVITAELRDALERSGLDLRHVTYRPIIKRHIVLLDWRRWDLSAEDPAVYPESGEPEDYILDRPHDPRLAEEMGDVWEVEVAPAASVDRTSGIRLISASWDGSDIFGAHSVGYEYFSQRARDWLAPRVAPWAQFESMPSV